MPQQRRFVEIQQRTGHPLEHMPELRWRYGYFIVLGLIAAICGTVFWRLRRNDWL
jgi:magnesium transporter